MKKIIYALLVAGFGLILAGCSENKEGEIPNPISDPGGYVPGMVDLNKKMQSDIQNSVNQENNKLNNALNDAGVNAGENKTMENDLVKKYAAAIIKTSLGDIKVKFYSADSPITVNNFLKLSQDKFYAGTKFHRVIKGFMIQGGDPLSKDEAIKDKWGTGGPGYKFADELKGTEKYPQGTLAMANSGPNTNGSQFFIVTDSPAAPLPPSYTVFGMVTEGLDIALKIENVKTGANDQPIEDVVINSVEVLEK